MFALPDVPTLLLCSSLASAAFVVVYISLWRAQRHQTYLLDWAASFTLYIVTLIGFVLFGYHPIISGILCGLLGLGNLLVLTGVYRFDGVKPFRSWMILAILLPGVGYLGPALLGYPKAAQIGATLGLIFDMLTIGTILVGGRRLATSGGRRIAGFALLGYVPGYVLAILVLATDGSIPDAVALLPMLSDQMLLAILNLGLMAMPGERAQTALRHIAQRDSLTGALNRAGLTAHASAISPGNAAIVAIDVDHFKAINDRHGHAAGDAVLVALATDAMRHASGRDLVVRLGGDEFIVVLAEATRATALAFSAELRRTFAAVPDLPPWTASMGVATVAPGETSLLPAIARADRALYDAKTAGRDRAVAA